MTDKGIDNLKFGIIDKLRLITLTYWRALSHRLQIVTWTSAEGSSGHNGFIPFVTLIPNRLLTDWKGKQRLWL